MYALIVPASTPFVLLVTVLGLSWWEDRILPRTEPAEPAEALTKAPTEVPVQAPAEPLAETPAQALPETPLAPMPSVPLPELLGGRRG
ncbi:hypothetical protein OG562_29845 [Streptomyces sp. NBC_01275]|uniref:hypothetical protein n=1 Tax=Streptomyces sp. NBC_01275 TaxID=2903807 RepID=UPI002250411A|nr:hypothetical protein [Streptomyces sp. NBC_01275]MCX4765104.1 hypothetical protein [Streptomyces sp. NBC_01275]